MYYILGIAAGAAVAVVIMILVTKLIRKATHQKGTWAKYDERQQAARGKGYKFAFFTMLILTAAALCWYSALDEAASGFPVPQVFLGIMLAGVLVYASYSVWSDAYIAPNETYRSSVILMAVIAAVNLGLGAVNYRMDGIDGSYLNFSIGAALAVICLEMVAKHLVDARRDDGDAE